MQTIYVFYLSLVISIDYHPKEATFLVETVCVLCIVGINLHSSGDYVRSVCVLMQE